MNPVAPTIRGPAPISPVSGSTAGTATAELLDDPREQSGFTRWRVGADGERSAQSQFQLGGLHCAACAVLIERALLELPGVRAASVSVAAARLEVVWDPTRTRVWALVEAVQRAGYSAVPDLGADARAHREAEHRQALWRLFVAGFCMMQVMMVAAPAWFAAPGEISADLQRLLNGSAWLLSLPVLLFSAAPFFESAWRGVRRGRISMDLPVAIGIAVTFVASSGAAFEPGGAFGHEVYFDSLTMFVFFLLGGRLLELRARHRAAAALEQSLHRLPDSVQRETAGGAFESVSVRRLVSGDRVRVLAGQAFPADGVLLEGHTRADEALLSGESRPLPKVPGAELVAGSINVGAPALMRVDRLGEDTRYAEIVALMRAALTQRPEALRLADRFAGAFLWGVLALAAVAALAWSFIDPGRAVWVAVSVLIVTCPCALSLATPSALLAASGALARHGVLWRRLEALEVLARVDTLFVDKTGTITEDKPVLGRLRRQSAVPAAVSDEQLLRMASSLAVWSSHPLSQALVAAGQVADATAPPDGNACRPVDAPAGAPWTEVSESPGLGLQGRSSDGTTWRLGSPAWVRGREVPAAQGTVCFGTGGTSWVDFAFEEGLRDGALAAVTQLRAAGVRVVLLSGDTPERVQAMASRLGLDGATETMGGATPEAKLAALAAAQAEGHVVAMAGDGINDAPVLARADVSFALAAGAALAQAQADAVLLGNRLADLVAAFALARRSVRVVRQNLAWAVLYNAACIPLAALGLLPPWAAGLGMALSSLVVVLNSLRLARPAAAAMQRL